MHQQIDAYDPILSRIAILSFHQRQTIMVSLQIERGEHDEQSLAGFCRRATW